MDTSSDDIRPKRKVRKGTHSCWECRRRKVKCLFSSTDDDSCITCSRRGKKCISQQVLDGFDGDSEAGIEVSYQSLQRHGDMTRRALHNDVVASYASSTPLSVPSTPAMALKDRPMQVQSTDLLKAPVPTLSVESGRPWTVESSKHPKVTQALLMALPSQSDLEILLAKVGGMSMMLYQTNYKPSSLLGEENYRKRFCPTNLHHDGHPVLMARDMLMFAAALQYLSPNAAIPGLGEHHHVIMEKLAESAIQLVTTNDVFLGTLEGLENICLEGCYHSDAGNIRRAWITMRRAVMAAQLMGLHRPSHHRFKVISNDTDLDPEELWRCIVSMERILSLLLGLPTSTTTIKLAVQPSSTWSLQGGNMTALITGVTSRILQRNECQESVKSLEMTREIDQELIKVTEETPSKFWRQKTFTGLEFDSQEALWEIRRTWDLMCYFTVVTQLHLPYMLCPQQAPQNHYSRMICVNASREILTREIAMRSFNPVTPCCRMGDFMALIAGMTLVLAHVVTHYGKESNNPLVHQRLGDRALVEQALECMTSMTEPRADVLSAKCAQLLRHLLAAEADAAQSHNQDAGDVPQNNQDCEQGCNSFTIKVPYVGGIQITRQGITYMPANKAAEGRVNYEGVTIGGIGSMRVHSPTVGDNNVYQDNDLCAGLSAPANTENTPVIQQDAAQLYQETPEDLFSNQDQMWPDAAAGLDDWVFQGLDTAFFDVLMREAGT